MKLNFLLLLIVLFSCNNNKQNKHSKDAPMSTSSSPEFNQSYMGILDFKDYWDEFGTALLTNDTNKIKLLVEVPLVILGREDQDPQLKIDSNQIVKYIIHAVNNGGYYDVGKDTSISNKSLLLSDLKFISEYKQREDIQWINDFVFKKTPQGWKLVTLYMDTKTMGNKLN